MTPAELALIAADAEHVIAAADAVSTTLYDALFEIAPDTRALFDDDVATQRAKLMTELKTMIAAAVAYEDAEQLARFIERTGALGRRHTGYGVTAAMYEPVGAALLASLRLHVPGFDQDHEDAWAKLYGLIAETMLEGAQAPPAMHPVEDG